MNKINILIIHADQHRWDTIGVNGNPDVKTPNIDALAGDGVRYPESFCPYPVCTPSRYSLLCGQYVHQHLGWNNRCTLPSGIATFPKELRNAGYRTAAVGKMHFSPTYLDVGFDTMILSEQDGPGRYDDDYHRYLMEQGLCDRIDLMDQVFEYREKAPQGYWDVRGAMESDLSEEHHSTTWIGDRAIKELESWQEEGNLLMAGFIKPHHPFDPPAPWSSMYDPDSLKLLPGWTEECSDPDYEMTHGYFDHKELTESQLRGAMAMYYASISQIDHHVGRMVDLLKEKGLYENTMIIYTSDHGDYLGFHHMLLKGNYLYDPLAKVPLIIKYPHQENSKTVSSRLLNNIDVAPTILTCAGLDVPESMQGHTLTDNDVQPDTVFCETGGQYMVRTGSRKLLECSDPGQSQFFDLEEDPLEMDNRINDPAYSGDIEDMKVKLYRWVLFDARSRVHLDWNAPQSKAADIPSPKQVEKAKKYFRKRMGEA